MAFTHLSKAVFEFISFLMSFLMTAGVITAPSAEDPIAIADPSTELSFIAIADPQICNYNPTREQHLIEACSDFKNRASDIDALVIAGDVAENGFQDEYDRITEDFKGVDFPNFICCTGNHDIRLREYEQSSSRFLAFLNGFNSEENKQTKTYYSYSVNGYKFIVLASEKSSFEDAYISEEQLSFLDSELADAVKDGKPAFVLAHYPLKDTAGLPDTWSNSLWESGSIGKQSDEVKEILGKYKNVFFITGHLHTGFGEFTYERYGNIISVNLPSLGIENKDGDYNAQGAGFIVEVTSGSVNFRARNFAEGVYLPEYDFTVGIE